MVGNQGLDHGPSGEFAPACPAHHLGQHIESRLPRPVSAGIETQICIQNTNQRHIRKIQTLGNHLGANQNGNLFLLEMLQNFFMGIHRIDGIRIHPVDFHIREQFFQFLLHLLGAGTGGFQRSAATGATTGGGLRMTTVVTHQPVIGAVVSQPHVASGTVGGFSTFHTNQRPGISPTV